jgi:glycosyltransferase involved in cell wall biosynthesis
MAICEIQESSNILIIDNLALNRWGGGQVFSSKLYNLLESSRIFRTSFLTLAKVENHPINIYLLNALEKLERISERRPSNRVVRGLIRISQHPKVRLRLYLEARCLRNRKFDLAICNDPLDLKIMLDGKPDVNKLVFILHDPESKNILLGKWKRTNRIFDVASIIRRAFSKYDIAIVALNRFDYEALKEKFAGRVYLIHIGIDLAKFAPDPEVKKENIILYVGRLEEDQKNISLLIRSFREMKRDDYQLVLIGDGPSRPTYEQMIRANNLTGSVSLLGYVSEATKIKYYRKAKIFVTPSKSETFGITTLEAMAAGCPPISVRNKGALELIVDGFNGFLVDNDLTQMKDSMLTIASDKELRRRLEINCASTVHDEFSEDRMRTNLVALIALLNTRKDSNV